MVNINMYIFIQEVPIKNTYKHTVLALYEIQNPNKINFHDPSTTKTNLFIFLRAKNKK